MEKRSHFGLQFSVQKVNHSKCSLLLQLVEKNPKEKGHRFVLSVLGIGFVWRSTVPLHFCIVSAVFLLWNVWVNFA